MGNKLARYREKRELEKNIIREIAMLKVLSDIRQRALSTRSRPSLASERDDESDQPKEIIHGWDPNDCSDNMAVFGGDLLVQKNDNLLGTDAVRGKQGYISGIHVWQIRWPKDERGTHAVIGVATMMAPLKCSGYKSLIGSNAKSIGWDIARNVIVYNDCDLKRYPEDSYVQIGFQAPDEITVILDLDSGTLSFKGGNTDYGMASNGMHLLGPLFGNELYPAVSVSKNGAQVGIKYLGELVSHAGFGSSPNFIKSDSDAITKRMQQTVELLKIHKITDVSRVCESVKQNLDLLYQQNEDTEYRQMMGDTLAELDGAQVISGYLVFLKGCGLLQVWDCYEVLRNVCWNYSASSHKFARSVGQHGKSILQLMASDLQMYKLEYKSDEKHVFLVLSAMGILHNCAKVDENKPVYHELGIMSLLEAYTEPHNLHRVIMDAMMTKSYIAADGNAQQADDTSSNDFQVEFLVRNFRQAVNNQDSHQSSGGHHAYEIAIAVANLANSPSIRNKIVSKGCLPLCEKLIEIGDVREKECAINAICVLVDGDTLVQMQETPRLLNVLRKLREGDDEIIKQAAERALLKIETPTSLPRSPTARTVVPTQKECNNRDLYVRFMRSLNIHECLFDERYNQCYCTVCHTGRGDDLYYARGQPPKDYGLPIGWYRFGLKVPPKAHSLNALDEWHRAFHGTKKDSVVHILNGGELLIPGDVALGGKKIKEGDGHYSEKWKPSGFDTKKIFVSPSIRYAGLDAYATPSKYVEGNKQYKAKVALQVLIKPDSYDVGEQTMGLATDIDPKFSNQEIEWSTNQRGSTILFGLMLKLENAL